MESRPATDASRAGATPLRRGLPEEIIVWEILVRLPPKSLLRCRTVCRAWRCATSTCDFFQAHHRRQPCLPIVRGSEYAGARHKNIFAFDHRAVGARLQPVARLDDSFCLETSYGAELQSIFGLGGSFRIEASCDGLLVLSKLGMLGTSFCFSVSNPATRQHAPLWQLSGFRILGMYAHRPTGEYRLLLHRATLADQIGCYLFVLRYIGGLEAAASADLLKPALVCDSLHWYPMDCESDPQQYRTGSNVVIVFNTTSELFRQMRAPVVSVSAQSYVFEMDGTLGIYSCNDANAMQIVDIWMLQNYESEDWGYKCRVALPVAEIRGRSGCLDADWYVSVDSVDGDLLLLVSHGGWMFYVETDSKLVESFRRDGQHLYAYQLRLKQTLVPHTFFTTLEGYDVNALPFV